MRWLAIGLILLSSSICYGQKLVSNIAVPTVDNSISTPNIVWNVWDTPNFEIWSIDKNQGERTRDNIEPLRDWIYRRWGFVDSRGFTPRFSSRCVVYCVPNRELMVSLFHLAGPAFVATRENRYIIWVLLDRNVSEVIPSVLTTVCLQQQALPVGFWVIRGTSILNGSLSQIRNKLSPFKTMIESNQKLWWSKSLFQTTEAQWLQFPDEHRKLFDSQAAMLCLLLRKEYGQDICLAMMTSQGTENQVQSILGFKSYAELDSTYKRFLYYVAVDINSGRMPSDYLLITQK